MINVYWSSCKVPTVLVRLSYNRLKFSLETFEKYSNTEFHENPLSGSRIIPCGRTDGQFDRDGQTDITNLTIAFRNFAGCALKPALQMWNKNFRVLLQFNWR
jgi:hypothetical protein